MLTGPGKVLFWYLTPLSSWPFIWNSLNTAYEWNKMLRGFVAEWSLRSHHVRYWTVTAQRMVENKSCLLKLFADKITAVKIPASGTRAKSAKVNTFPRVNRFPRFAIDAHIHNVDLQNATQLLLLPGDTKVFIHKFSQAIQLSYRAFLIAPSSSVPGPNLQGSKIKCTHLSSVGWVNQTEYEHI